MLQALRKLTGTPEHELEPVTHHHLLFGSCHRCRCLDRGRRNLQRRQRNYRLQRLSRIRSRRRSRMRRNLRPPPLGQIRCPRRRISLFERDKPPTVELNEVQPAAAAAEPNQMSPAPAITVEPCKGRQSFRPQRLSTMRPHSAQLCSEGQISQTDEATASVSRPACHGAHTIGRDCRSQG
jgi:hypothetical protein